ncbi:hypothetical protein [Alteromonas halophila]|uniref:Uncharacterized protein n=1 Tax=Alteromonas halophila TaxID=516698 RepID=A0A918MYM0_9ALTE|nr:hypothetical protein [Alteromonas halophila]GGW88656.1 hypothetical protein GCM10007391_23530 [Alteromonas halophila]
MQNYKYKMATKRLQKILGPITILIVAAGIFWAQQELSTSDVKSNSDIKSLQCNFVNSKCQFLLDGEPATARFDRTPATEEPITVTFTLPSSVTITRARITGVNMFMGQIPLILDKTDNRTWEGWFMLGSCSEPVMQWQITVEIKGRSAPAHLFFSTTRNTDA